MISKTLRKIVRIDEGKCDGCGACVPSCAEGALKIIDGKARLIGETYCDGLGACLGECPQGAITLEEREAEEFDEEAVERLHHGEQEETTLPCGCSSATVTSFEKKQVSGHAVEDSACCQSMLGHWPVQMTLVPPDAPFLQGADVVLAADCVPFACAGFHREFLEDHALLVACPKLDDYQAHLRKLADILRRSNVRSLKVVHMEVPCCSGLVQMARQAVKASGREVPIEEVTIGIRGDILARLRAPG